jgi:hypothetical protein
MSSVPSQVYSAGIAAPSTHGPANCIGVAAAFALTAVEDVTGANDVDVDDELVDDVAVVDEVDVVVGATVTTKGGAVVVVVDVDVVVWDSR